MIQLLRDLKIGIFGVATAGQIRAKAEKRLKKRRTRIYFTLLKEIDDAIKYAGCSQSYCNYFIPASYWGWVKEHLESKGYQVLFGEKTGRYREYEEEHYITISWQEKSELEKITEIENHLS